MKRILGQGYIETTGNRSGDLAVKEYGFENVYLTYKIKVPEYLVQLFREYGKVDISQDLYNEYYVPSLFVKQDGSKIVNKEGLDLNTKFQNFYRFLSNFHDKLSKQDVALEQLAYLLPFGIFVTFAWSVTANEVINFLQTNLNNKIPERKEIAEALLVYFRESFPLTASEFLRRE
jgi:hypothetical protein